MTPEYRLDDPETERLLQIAIEGRVFSDPSLLGVDNHQAYWAAFSMSRVLGEQIYNCLTFEQRIIGAIFFANNPTQPPEVIITAAQAGNTRRLENGCPRLRPSL